MSIHTYIKIRETKARFKKVIKYRRRGYPEERAKERRAVGTHRGFTNIS